MKLTIGENIRNFRKKHDLTQEAFADRLGVTYQSVSRWENGTTYPDLELLPAIAEALSVTFDELLGMPQIEKEKRAAETFDELRRECVKREYDADKIVALLRDIRHNYLDSESAWRPWVEGNGSTFRDPKILPEVRLLAQAYLDRHPMDPHAIQTVVEIEDEEHLQAFLDKYTTPFDCSARNLLYHRYLRRWDSEHFEPERRYQLYQAFGVLLCPRYFLKLDNSAEDREATDAFMENMLSLIRCDAVDERPDMWIDDRLEQGFKSAERLAKNGQTRDAIAKLESVVKLLEDTMKITDEVLLPTSCRFLDGMVWYAKELWDNTDNHPDSPIERYIYIATQMSGMSTCYCIFPSRYLWMFDGDTFAPLHGNPQFEALRERIKALIVTKEKEDYT